MKTIKRMTVLVLVLTLVMSMITFASASGTVHTTAKANLRKNASIDSKSLTVIPSGQKLGYSSTKTDNRGVKWYKVKYEGKTGWVSSLYASTHKGGDTKLGTVKLEGGVYLRQKANKNSKKLGTIEKGTRLDYYSTSVDSRGVKWYLVHYHGTTGWVSGKYSDTASKNKKVIATDGQSYVRKSPDKGSKILETMRKGDIATYAGSTRKDSRGVAWYKVRYCGVTGWVSSRYTNMK